MSALHPPPQKQAAFKAKGPQIPRQPYARMNFLYQASMLLSVPTTSTQPSGSPQSMPAPAPLNPALSRFYLSTLRSVAQKNVLRIHPSIKRTICKRCETHLVPGVSCTIESENRSRGGRKAWAEVIVVKCGGCGGVKRFPVRRGKGKKGEEEKGEGYTLWCEREDVVEGVVVGGGSGNGSGNGSGSGSGNGNGNGSGSGNGSAAVVGGQAAK